MDTFFSIYLVINVAVFTDFSREESSFKHLYTKQSSDPYSHSINKNNKKNFSIKMKEDVGMSKPQKNANNVGKLTWDPKSLLCNPT